jgi:hypothetical protein
MKRIIAVGTLPFLLFFILSFNPSKNETIPGEITTPYPTITCLAIEWLIEGDENLNGEVKVLYRKAGDNIWLNAMSLIRIPEGNSGSHTNPTYFWKNKHSGSILNLRPDTEYEIRLQLSDPDGGNTTNTIKARTRPVPKEAEDARSIEVNPSNFKEAVLRAIPGDVFLLSPGFYDSFTMPVNGEPGKPIVIRADNSHPQIGSTFNSVNLEHRKHVIIDGLTIWGPVNLRWAENVAVRYCTIESSFGIIAQQQPGAKNCYIADNTVRFKMPWVNETIGSGSIWGGAANIGEGIELTGPGNVICHNRVSGFRDGISTMEDLWVYDQRCIDIYNNDISECPDDGIEADFAMGNCRIMNNRITNCGMGVSSQPGLGGPTYFIRNAMYNIAMSPFKVTRGSYGDIILHNTVVKAGDGFYQPHGPNAYFRTVWLNNLCIGGSGGGKMGRYSGGEGLAVSLPGYNETCLFDYNAVGTVNNPFAGTIGNQRFDSLEGLHRLTGAKNCIRINMDVFASAVEFPDPVFPERQAQDLRIAHGSMAEDAALILPNINDDFTGKAPDIGAYETGKTLPLYGPRPRGVDESTLP